MAITDYQMSEIKRKAGLGEKMLTPDAEKMKIYNQYAKTNNPYAPKVQPQQQMVGTQPKQNAYQSYVPGTKVTNVNQPSYKPYNSSLYQPNSNSMNSLAKNSIVQTHDDSSKTYNFGNTNFDQNQMNEISYYDDMKSNLLKQRHDLTMNESRKGLGITEDFSRNALAPLQKQYYEIENDMLKKYGQFGGRGGESNDYGLYGLDRDSLGMNSVDANGFRVHDTANEFSNQQRLTKPGMSAQKAYEQLRGINPNVAYSPTNQFNNNNSMFASSPQNQFNNGGGEPMAKISNMSAPTPYGSAPTQYNANTSANSSSGIPDYQMSEIIRKAQAGIPLDQPTAEKMAVYNSYRNNQPSTQGNQANSNLDSIYEPQKQAQISRFNAERDRALGLINQQKTEAKSQYAGARNQTDVVNAQNVNRLREMMASNGISGSGENVTANVALGSARQGALSGLNMQEQQQNNDFNRQIAEASSQEKLNAVLAEIEAQKAQAIMEEMWRNKEFEYGAGRDRIADTRYADETQYGRGQDSKQWDYQAGRDAVSDGRYNKEWGYNVGRDAIADKRYLDELTYARNQAAQSSRGRGSSGRGSGGSSSGGGSYSSGTRLPTNPTKPTIMSEQQYIDAYEQPNARHKGTARVIPGSSDYAKKMQKILSDLYK